GFPVNLKLQACHVPMGTAVTGRSILDTVGLVFQSFGVPWDSILVGSNFRILPKKSKTRYKISLEFEPPSVQPATRPKSQRFSLGTKPEQSKTFQGRIRQHSNQFRVVDRSISLLFDWTKN